MIYIQELRISQGMNIFSEWNIESSMRPNRKEDTILRK